MAGYHNFEPPSQPGESAGTRANSANGGNTGRAYQTFAPGTDEGLNHYAMHNDDQETTRYLSAATQINIKYARSVVNGIVYEPFRALPPGHGADVTVVTRWALDSLRRRLRRDTALASVLFSGIAIIWLLYVMIPELIWIPILIPITLIVAFFIVAREHWVRWHSVIIGQMRVIQGTG